MRSNVSISLKPRTAQIVEERGLEIKNLSDLVDKLLFEHLSDGKYEKKEAFKLLNEAKEKLARHGITVSVQEPAKQEKLELTKAQTPTGATGDKYRKFL